MKLFERISSTWVRYSEYGWKKADDGTLYLTSALNAKPSIYAPLKETQEIVLDALQIGRLCKTAYEGIYCRPPKQCILQSEVQEPV